MVIPFGKVTLAACAPADNPARMTTADTEWMRTCFISISHEWMWNACAPQWSAKA
jgi:hypothetical protein